MLKRLGFSFDVVAEQDRFDGRFSTVKSPNPENAEALTMAIDLAKNEDADLVVATDPDCDRMGAAVRGKSGKMKLLTGNHFGSLTLRFTFLAAKRVTVTAALISSETRTATAR